MRSDALILEVTAQPKPLLFANLPDWAQQRAIESESGCWLWQGSLARGYGRIKSMGKVRVAHRPVYEAMVGAIPEGLELDHLCRVRNCVNPAHLEPVTRWENLWRGTSRFNRTGVTHCKRGHSLHDGYVNKKGCRNCRPCAKQRSSERWKRVRDGG